MSEMLPKVLASNLIRSHSGVKVENAEVFLSSHYDQKHLQTKVVQQLGKGVAKVYEIDGAAFNAIEGSAPPSASLHFTSLPPLSLLKKNREWKFGEL